MNGNSNEAHIFITYKKHDFENIGILSLQKKIISYLIFFRNGKKVPYMA